MMVRRVASPGVQADRLRGEDEIGRAVSAQKARKTALNRHFNHWGWSNGRMPGLTIAAIPVRTRAPKRPE